MSIDLLSEIFEEKTEPEEIFLTEFSPEYCDG